MKELKSLRNIAELDDWYPVLSYNGDIEVYKKVKIQPDIKPISFLANEIAFGVSPPRFLYDREPSYFQKLRGITKEDIIKKRWRQAVSFCNNRNAKRKKTAAAAEKAVQSL